MPLIYVQRYAPPTAAASTDGTQYVDGALSFAGATTIVLSNDVYGTTQQYVLFDYSGGSFPTPAQLSNVTIDTSNLILSEFDSLTDDTANDRIILTLKSLATNGKQFVDGNLDIAGPTTVILNSTLYATAGTYELFEVTGTISPASVGNLSCVAAKAGLTAGVPYQIGNIIYVTLA